MTDNDPLEGAKKQALGIATGAAYGAIAGTPMVPRVYNPRLPNLSMQVSSTTTAAMRNGASLGSALAAGAGVVTTKVAAVYAATTAAAVAAAPVVAGAAVVYGLYRLWKRL